jgi:hypothetical protein|tara:strand:- start:341 stop:1354 length:1014 start_codon:yes stop_codon:yes gene_type:complete
MIINEPLYFYNSSCNYIDENLSILRPKNIVNTIENCEIILLTNYDALYDKFYNDFVELIVYSKENNKKIYYDSTTELISENFIDRIQIHDNLSTLTILTNGPTNNYEKKFYNLRDKGVTLIVEQFFVKYEDYYVPIKIQHKDLDRKKFLMLGGKSKDFRTAITGLIFGNDLHKYGHISYFGFEPLSSFTNETVYDYFMSDSPIEQKLRVKEGILKMGGNKLLDVDTFDFKVSHTRRYDSTPYDLVEFVVVLESDINHDRHFITEKTTKCVQMNKKFILLSAPNMLEKTKQYYKKYHNKDISHLTDWCDTSYDQITNKWGRIDKIYEVIEKSINGYLI